MVPHSSQPRLGRGSTSRFESETIRYKIPSESYRIACYFRGTNFSRIDLNSNLENLVPQKLIYFQE